MDNLDTPSLINDIRYVLSEFEKNVDNTISFNLHVQSFFNRATEEGILKGYKVSYGLDNSYGITVQFFDDTIFEETFTYDKENYIGNTNSNSNNDSNESS